MFGDIFRSTVHTVTSQIAGKDAKAIKGSKQTAPAAGSNTTASQSKNRQQPHPQIHSSSNNAASGGNVVNSTSKSLQGINC